MKDTQYQVFDTSHKRISISLAVGFNSVLVTHTDRHLLLLLQAFCFFVSFCLPLSLFFPP